MHDVNIASTRSDFDACAVEAAQRANTMDDRLDSRDIAIQSNMSSSMNSLESDLAHHAGQDHFSESTVFSPLKRRYASPEGPEKAGSPYSSGKKQKLGAVPRINWNAGTKATIRTSFKGGEYMYNQKLNDAGRQTAGQ